jgi:hypothetical protein
LKHPLAGIAAIVAILLREASRQHPQRADLGTGRRGE